MNRSFDVIRLVAGREVNQRIRTKSFPILTGVLVVVVLGIGIATRLLGGDPEPVEVAVSPPVPAGFADALVSVGDAFERELVVTEVADADAARQALRDGDAGIAVVGAERTTVFDGAVDPTQLALVQQAWSMVETRQSLLDAGLTDAQITEALAAPPVEGEPLEDDDEAEGIAILAGTLGAVLLFMSLQTFGGYVLMGVVEEKSTAVVEVLLARVRADQLLAGKVLGIGVAALVQFAATVAAAVLSLRLSGVEVPGAIWSAVPMLLVWFLLGYTMYSMLFAMAGSLVSRQEDAQAAAAPIMSALIGGYILVYVFGYVPESLASRILSVIPPVTPFLMPMRMAAGAASMLEIVAAVVLMLLTTVGVARLAGRIYEQSLLQRGGRIGWKQALRPTRS